MKKKTRLKIFLLNNSYSNKIKNNLYKVIQKNYRIIKIQ